MATMDEYIDQLLAEMDTAKPLQGVVHNILDETIPESLKRRLLKPLLPGKYRNSAQPSKRKEGGQAIQEKFDPIPPKKTRTV